MELLNTYPASITRKRKPQKIDTVDGIDLYRIPEHDNYGISKCGKVYSFERRCAIRGGRTRKVTARWLKPRLSGSGYPIVTLSEDGVERIFTVHRLMGVVFLGASDDDRIDHIDRVKTSNHLWNLRTATHSQNKANSGRYKNNSSGFKGVYWDKHKKRWRARIGVNGRQIFLGYFNDPEEAARAYDAAALKHFGEFAQLNFPVPRA